MLGESFPTLLHGDASSFGFALERALLISGDEVSFTPAGITAIVGGNNVGKSTFLVELVNKVGQYSGNPQSPTKIVDSIHTHKRGEQRDAVAWLAQHSTFFGDSTNPGFMRPGAGHQHITSQVSHWGSDAPEVGPIHPFLCFYGNAQGRFGLSGSVEMRESHTDPPTHPVHALQDSAQLRSDLNRATAEVFRTELTLDNLGRTLRLRVGRLEASAPPVDDVSADYREAMASLPTLDEQGDGMRSLLGILLPLITASYPLIVIDEPEAFLHPPQAHALGRQLGLLAASRQVQVIVATHDKDFLAGLLESDAPVSVVRLTRDRTGVHAHQLVQDKVRELWTDPVLRYTNVLDGLFHRLVVLAEAEGDCSYLSAALDAWDSQARGDTTVATNEVLFLPTGGKGGMTKVARALSAVRVPVVAAPDLDVLAEKSVLKALVEAVGGSWTADMEANYDSATRDLRGSGDTVKVGSVLDAINELLSQRRDEDYTAPIKEQVKTQLRSGSGPWAHVKQFGLSAFKGEAAPAVRTLLSLLEAQRVVPVHEGELESLAPEIAAAKGPGWLPEALAQAAFQNSATQKHVARILDAGLS